jgi:hypothetical protein
MNQENMQGPFRQLAELLCLKKMTRSCFLKISPGSNAPSWLEPISLGNLVSSRHRDMFHSVIPGA